MLGLSNMASVLSPLSTARQSIGYTPQEPAGAKGRKGFIKRRIPVKLFLYKRCAIFFSFFNIPVWWWPVKRQANQYEWLNSFDSQPISIPIREVVLSVGCIDHNDVSYYYYYYFWVGGGIGLCICRRTCPLIGTFSFHRRHVLLLVERPPYMKYNTAQHTASINVEHVGSLQNALAGDQLL